MALTRRPKKLPAVLSPEEVEKLIEAAPNTRYRMILLLWYLTRQLGSVANSQR
jgi:hypothetical protein